MRRAPIALTMALAAALAWGCQGDDAAFRTLVPDRVGTAELPFDTRGLIALLADETTACVSEDYEYRVHCFDRGGEVVGVFGGEGEGPGEFDMTNVLVGGHDGTVGVLDFGLNRFSVFEPSGALVTEMLLPGAAAADFIPVWRFGESVAGVAITTFDFALFETGAGSGGFMSMFEIDIASGTVVRQEELPPVDAEIECEKVHYGFPGPGGGWVFTACGGHVVFVSPGGETTVVRAPTYTDELPSERDIAAWTESRRARGRAGVGGEALEQFRNTPKEYHLSWSEKFDDQGRFWIATERDRDEFSWLDVYVPREGTFFASVRVHDRVLGFDVAGSTLAVLVERTPTPDDPEGIPARAVDWYDIGGWR
ncbi:MAG: hypothetical protein F4Z31_12425 [Gemmatimonadetes bacterium]|nr:hypothetical protein [Gemmatimonadota bacterium]MYA42546.1 hypothetical protein [Gemmatimonadota bacterium]MYJ12355.1 hypothetical protein [Gemmatimonadota bacterium]